MAGVVPISPTRIGDTDIVHAQGIRAGNWLFFTGHLATDYRNGIAASVAGKPGLPLGGAPRYRREGDFLLARLSKLIADEGGTLRHIVRVDQYYPRAECVNPYQRARRALLGDYVPPSTSVLTEELLIDRAGMDISMLAVLPGDNREPKPAKPEGVPVPKHSGFIPSLVVGDYVFVAGQMANNESMTGLAPNAYRPPSARWNGMDIRLQTEFLIVDRLRPALEAGGSSLENAIKAQVYLTDINDLPEFLGVWNSYFGKTPCALTVVETKGLGLSEAIVEINIFGVRYNSAVVKRVIDHQPSAPMRLGPAAVCAGDLLCLSGLYAANEDGILPEILNSRSLHYLGIPIQREMNAILTAAEEICHAAGTSLSNVTRAQHFVSDLNVVYPAMRAWHAKLPDAPIPFGIVRTPLPVPGCGIVLDMWAYISEQ